MEYTTAILGLLSYFPVARLLLLCADRIHYCASFLPFRTEFNQASTDLEDSENLFEVLYRLH
jgi:hypothetical protein